MRVSFERVELNRFRWPSEFFLAPGRLLKKIERFLHGLGFSKVHSSFLFGRFQRKISGEFFTGLPEGF